MHNWREANPRQRQSRLFRSETQGRSVEALEGRIAELERFCGQLALENTV